MIYVLLAEGFEEVEALTPLDMLLRAGADVKTVSITEEKSVRGAHGICVAADLSASEAKYLPELLILPGGMPGTRHLDGSPFVDALVRDTVKKGGRLAAICAAPMVLGKRGLLVGKHAVCYPGFEEMLTGAYLSENQVVTDGLVTTATGVGSALLFGAELVRLMYGEETKDRLLDALQYRGPRPLAENRS